MLQREAYSLRPIAEKDLETVREWRNSERVRVNMYTDHIITAEEHQAWFNRLQEQRDSVYLVFESENQPIGMVYFTNIDRRNSKSLWGFYLGSECLPKGTGTIMGLLGLQYAFEKLSLRKLCGEVFAFNSASIGLFKRLGFTVEGNYRKHILKNGDFEDVVFFSLLREEWQAKRMELEKMAFY